MLSIILYTVNWLDNNNPETLKFWSLIHSTYTDHLLCMSDYAMIFGGIKYTALQYNLPLNYNYQKKNVLWYE